MKLIKASKTSQQLVDEFLAGNQQIDKAHILNSGYLLTVDHKICGCFVLDPISKGKYVLRQFFVTTTDALKIPVLVECVLLLAKEKQATEVFVHSHKLMIDMILEALDFSPHENDQNLDKYAKSDGKWWSYKVS